MNQWLAVLLVSFVVIAAGLFLYWQLVVAEGAYLGSHVVTLLYDIFASHYDKVKQFQLDEDTLMMALPIMRYLNQVPILQRKDVQILDVATGTGRLPLALLVQKSFQGHITALDLSASMLRIAKAKLDAYAKRISWSQQDAQYLPSVTGMFDVVTCLEALEFMPQPRLAVAEMLRVLKPGGLLLISNRVGPDAWKLPGRTQPTKRFIQWLHEIGFHHIHVDKWLVDYDLVWALK